MENSKQNSFMFLAVIALSAFTIQGFLNGINPALGYLMAEYPQYSVNTIMLVSTLVSLCSIPTNLLFGAIVNKLGFKVTSLIGIILVLVGGLAPFFLTSFPVILAFRVLLALGYGMVFPMGAALTSAYFRDDVQKARVIGWGNTVMAASGIAFAMIAGVLVAIGIKYVWLVNLIMVIPFIFALVMPEPKTEKTESAVAEKSNEKIGKSWFFIICYTVLMIFMYPYFLNMSSVVIAVGGTPVDSGLMGSLFTVGAVLAGLIFGFLFKAVPNRLICVAAIIFCPSMFLFAYAKSILMLDIMTVIAGIGWVLMVAYMYTGIAISAPPSKTATAMGLIVAGSGLGQFVAPYCSTAISTFFGQSGNIRFPIVVCVVVVAVLAIVLLVNPLKLVESK
ncbi:MAG: MFS transporter [Dehalobacter sp.]|nr:MFS transporter [Dehalobacter sp.]